jgi:hypothetical protein
LEEPVLAVVILPPRVRVREEKIRERRLWNNCEPIILARTKKPGTDGMQAAMIARFISTIL